MTITELQEALRKALCPKGISDREIKKLANYLISFFGYNNEVIDNLLEPEDRDVFYMLEEEGLLTTRQEEVRLKRGRLWRIHYWVLKIEYIKKLASEKEHEEDEDYRSVYDEVSEEVWTRHRA